MVLLLGLALTSSQVLQPLLGAKAAVRLALREQPLDQARVRSESLALKIGPVAPPLFGSFIPLETQVAQPVENDANRLGRRPLPIRVFHAEDEGSTVMTSE